MILFFFFFSSRRRHTRSTRDWSSDVCSSDLEPAPESADLTSVSVTTSLPRQVRRLGTVPRSEERRVGKEWRSGWAPYHEKKKRSKIKKKKNNMRKIKAIYKEKEL